MDRAAGHLLATPHHKECQSLCRHFGKGSTAADRRARPWQISRHAFRASLSLPGCDPALLRADTRVADEVRNASFHLGAVYNRKLCEAAWSGIYFTAA